MIKTISELNMASLNKEIDIIKQEKQCDITPTALYVYAFSDNKSPQSTMIKDLVNEEGLHNIIMHFEKMKTNNLIKHLSIGVEYNSEPFPGAKDILIKVD